MIFNGIDFNNYFIIENIERRIAPQISASTVEINGKQGSRFIKNELGSLNIDVGIRIVAKDRARLQQRSRELANKLHTKGLRKLILDDEPDKFYMSILNGDTNINKIGMTGAITLTFLCPDPIAHGETNILNITNNPTIYYRGTYPTTGTIKINLENPVDHLQIILENTGEYIYLEHDFIAGDVITVDLEEEVAYKNGYSIMADCYLESDFFDIPVGEFKISVSSGIATLEFTERWL